LNFYYPGNIPENTFAGNSGIGDTGKATGGMIGHLIGV
jgi:hypothetical protein